jgi:uncharacterized protein (UPF0262 family)
MTVDNPFRLIAVTLDERTVVHRTRQIEQEREIAIYDLLEGNSFQLVGSKGGPYRLLLGIEENRLVFDLHLEDDTAHGKVMLSLTPMRKVIKDYFLICDSYFKAIRTAPPSQIEALDMARRASHNEGSELLKERLAGKIEVDFDTARRLFTLICVLHLKG